MAYRESNISSNLKKNARKKLKITVIGSGMVGKTCLLYTYVNNKFIEHGPTVFENYPKDINVDGKTYKTCLWDTAGQEGFQNIRTLSYNDTDCFIICFSISHRDSFNQVESDWYPDVKYYCKSNHTKIPVILVGTKSDLRQDEKQCTSISQGNQLRKKIKAVKYIECSAKNNENLSIVFEEAIRAIQRRSTKCCIIF